MTEDSELRKEARRRARKKLEFYTHLVVYIVVISIIISVWYFTGTEFPWIIFPIIGWGIAVLIHFLRTFVYTGEKLLDEMAEKEYEKLKEE
jgi:hypothetical protein